MTIHPADNQSTLHHHQLPNPTLSIQFNATSSDSNNNLSSVKSENKSSNRSNKIVIKKTSTTTITTNRSSIILTSSGVKTIVGKYNRRNNPDLEKRRIHSCDFMGKLNGKFACQNLFDGQNSHLNQEITLKFMKNLALPSIPYRVFIKYFSVLTLRNAHRDNCHDINIFTFQYLETNQLQLSK
jgi:hypothetical protein